MARYIGPKEKLERRIGTKLFLKGERSYSPKSAMVKKPYPPGMHGKKRFRRFSEYGSQLQKKQKVKYIYRMLERQFKSFVKKAIKSKVNTSNLLAQLLESRLDNTVYRIGMAQSRDQAKQLVNHGHILVNKFKITIPSYKVKKGDLIEIREGSKKSHFFSSFVPQWISKNKPPGWIKVDIANQKAEITGIPTIEESGLENSDLQSIIEFYSR